MRYTVREIQLSDAADKFSAIVDEAIGGEPSVIMRRGKKVAVVLSYEEWRRLSSVPSFGRLLAAAPVRADDLAARNCSGPRKANL